MVDPILLGLASGALGTIGLIAWAEKELEEKRRAEMQRDAREQGRL